MKKIFLKILLVLAAIVASLFLIELFLRITEFLKLTPNYSALYGEKSLAKDDILFYKLAPKFNADIDGSGFRNNLSDASASIIAVGDSQTYGYNAYSEESWPKTLAKKIKQPIYNMGIGGYGPNQYYYIFNEALKGKPKIIIVGFYLGNDFDDVCCAFHNLEYWQKFASANNLDISSCVTTNSSCFGEAPPQNFIGKSISFLRSSQTFSFLKSIKFLRDFYSYQRDLKLARNNPEYLIIDEPEFKTITGTTAFLDSPRLRSEIKSAKFFYKAMADAAKKNNVKMAVVFIPSKSSAVYDFLISKKRILPEVYKNSVERERRIVQDFSLYLDSIEVDNVDATPLMAQRIGKSAAPLFVNYIESHPTAAGYEAIAEAVFEKVFNKK